MFYFNKDTPEVLFCDCRKGTYELSDNRIFEVSPDVQCDVTALPFADNNFYHVVFDPPQLRSLTEKSDMFVHYTRITSDWQIFILDGFAECWRVLKPGGTLVFKWNEHDISFKRVIAAIGREPIYGNKNLKGKTH
jgi:ubiquinone/menaquinone biosynthesis C-methylase UbiE